MRIGRLAWELKIDPKRFRKKTKDYIEEKRTKRNEKKQPKASKRDPRELQ